MAATSSRHGWHLPVIGTVDAKSRAAMRTGVLRAADQQRGQLTCHTDRRSLKVEHLLRNPALTWLFYDASIRVQLSIVIQATVHTEDELADHRWKLSRLESRRCYLAPLPPGLPSESLTVNLPENLQDRPPSEAEAAAGRENFAVIHAGVQTMNFLWLNHRGNVRSCFNLQEDGGGEASWLTP